MRFAKCLLALCTFIVFSCSNAKDKEEISPSSISKEVAKADTFNLHDLEADPKLQENVLLDTINIPENKIHAGLSVIYPKLSPAKPSYAYKWVKGIVDETRRDFYKTIKEDEALRDTNETDFKYSRWAAPRLLFRTNKVMSYILEEGGGYRVGSAWFAYHSFNFDLKKKTEITLGDYFILKTKADSSFLENIFQRCVNKEFSLDRYKDFPQDFAFDSSAVHFLFDKYDLLGWGIYSVEKKYILDHINPAYR